MHLIDVFSYTCVYICLSVSDSASTEKWYRRTENRILACVGGGRWGNSGGKQVKKKKNLPSKSAY